MTRRPAARDGAPAASEETAPSGRHPLRVHETAPTGLGARYAAPRTRAEVEERYVAARDAWSAAMKRANSGAAADLAALAIAQEAYEVAVAERERWESSGRVAIPIEPDGPHPDLGAVIGQELRWREVRTHDEKPRGFFGRFRRRRRGDDEER